MTNEEAIKVLSESIHYGSKVPWDKIVEAVHLSIEALSKPFLPSELDEAAENSWAVYEYRESPRGLYSTCYLDGFKDGAEWMAGQGETHELTVESPVLGPPMICCPVHADNGDKVVVQIRKK